MDLKTYCCDGLESELIRGELLMKRIGRCIIVLLLILFSTTGCWNLKEPNQLAFFTGNGLDLTEDGKLEATVLIVTPAGIGGGQFSSGDKKKGYQVVSATGKNVSDAITNIQSKLSRHVFPGHRDIFLVGQRLAEQGIGETIDPFLRNAHSDLRSLIYLVKDGKPEEIFSIEPFFDQFITTSLSDEQTAIGIKPYLAREFVIDVLSEGTQPLMPVVSLNPQNHYNFDGSAIFNKEDNVKLVGFLNKKETFYANWVKDRLSSHTLTSFINQGDGTISITLGSFKRHITVKEVDEEIHIDLRLSGKGTIIENSTNLDPSKGVDLKLIEDELEKITQKAIEKQIKMVQKKYKMDIYGFGESVHQQYPKQWKTIKHNWSEHFSQLHVSVNVDLTCNNPGQANWSIYP